MSKYLINGKNYDGKVVSLMHENNESIFSGKPLSEYTDKDPDLICVSEDEWYEKYHRPFLENLSGNWKEITAEQANDVFECLPPFVKEIEGEDIFCFMNPEADEGHLHGHYVRIGGVWKCALMSKFATGSEIVESINK